MFVMLLLGWLPWLLFAVAVLVLGLRAVRALERRTSPNTDLIEIRERVQALEDALAEQGRELRRVADGQQFAERLLTSRAAGTDDSVQQSPGV